MTRARTGTQPIDPTPRGPQRRAGIGDGPGADLPELEQSLPITLLRARDAVIARLRPILQPLEVTEQQWRILRVLAQADGPLTVGQLTDATTLLGPSIARILPALEQRGHITRRTHPTDARRIECTISPAGRDLVDGVAPQIVAEYARIEAHLGRDGLLALDALLTRLAQIDGDPGEERHGPTPDQARSRTIDPH